MTKVSNPQQAYMVFVIDDPEVVDTIRFTFVPKKPSPTLITENPVLSPAEYIVSVQGHDDQLQFHWIKPPVDEAIQEELEGIVGQRMTVRQVWLEKLRTLMTTVKGWADDLGWATRIVSKKMDDAEIGNYRAPALLLQKETVRLFLEPVARKAPGAEGVVDLCLMPSYDDIANLYYYNQRWNLHYIFEGQSRLENLPEAEAKPLTRTTLEKVFGEMEAHAE
jgi:hypothetical protein